MTTYRPPPSVLRNLLRSESGSGLVLMGAAAASLLVANSALAPDFFAALDAKLAGLTLLHWINDGLMAVFFLLVGLEIKREFVDGELSSWRRRILPGVAAAGGMAVPALLYVLINASNPQALRGWAIPMATDIAFALGVLALFGKRVPVSLKVFLTALAIIDDLGAVTIIALFYSEQIDPLWLSLATVLIAALWAMNRARVRHLGPYLVLGALLWLCTLHSGVHAAIAGVALALTIPIDRSPGRPEDQKSPLHRLEHALQPWVGFLVVPIFGFANAGVQLSLAKLAAIDGIPAGIFAGLFLGKQIGVFGASYAAIRLGFADRPRHATWPQLYGVAVLSGIGFTMSLFIGLLAFGGSTDLVDGVKVGVLIASLASAVMGGVILVFAESERVPTASR